MSCRAEVHRRVQSAKYALAECDDVVDATVLAAPDGRAEKPSVDVVLRPAAGGVSPAVAEVTGQFGLTVRRVQRQGTHWQALLVA